MIHSSPTRTRRGFRRTLRSTSVLVAAVMALSGCAVASSPRSSGTAGSHELRPLTKHSLAATLTASAERNLVPGAFAVVAGPDGTVSASYGTTMLGRSRPPQASDVFRIGSVTKTMTAMVILQLVGEGELALTDPIDQFVPGVPNGASITIADLLQMRSGLHNYLDTDGFAASFDGDMTTLWTPEQLVRFGIDQPTVSAPNTAFDYSNTNTILLGMVAERLDGKSLADIFHDRLFEPLGMNHTELPETTTLPDPLVQGYQYGVFPINHRPLLSAAEQSAAQSGELRPGEVTEQSATWSWAAGGVVSTADDLMKWAAAMGDGRLLDSTMHRAWLDDLHSMDPAHASDGPRYGLGIEQARFGTNRVYLHEGELPGFNTIVAVDPAHGVRLVVWTNLALSVDGQGTAKAIATDVIGKLYRTKLSSRVLPVEGE